MGGDHGWGRKPSWGRALKGALSGKPLTKPYRPNMPPTSQALNGALHPATTCLEADMGACFETDMGACFEADVNDMKTELK